jgi:hypothetical protein
LIKQLEDMHPALPIDAPIRISQAAFDKRVNAALTLLLKDALEKIPGNTVEYKPYTFVAPTTGDFAELGAHFGLIDTDRGALVQWLKVRFGEDS